MGMDFANDRITRRYTGSILRKWFKVISFQCAKIDRKCGGSKSYLYSSHGFNGIINKSSAVTDNLCALG